MNKILNRMSASATRRSAMAACVLASTTFLCTSVWGQAASPIRIGILSDMSGFVADLSGPGSVVAAKMAVEDFGGRVLNRPIELLEADHLNKPDTGLTIARQWYDSGVRAIFDIGITTVALGVQDLAREKNRIVVFNSSASSDLTGKNCSPNGIHWTYNNYSQALGAVKASLDAGGKSWYFLTIDYTYGKNLQAQASKADVVALATTTSHAAAMIKQAEEFGLRKRGQRLAPLSLTLHDVKALGLNYAQDLFVTEPYYWDQNDQTRAFANRYRARFGKMPNFVQASVYGAVQHYLKAVAAAGTDDTGAVLAKMKSTPINDMMTKDGSIREDGRVIREGYVFRVKKPSESKNEWDLYTLASTIPAQENFQPADKAVCSLVK